MAIGRSAWLCVCRGWSWNGRGGGVLVSSTGLLHSVAYFLHTPSPSPHSSAHSLCLTGIASYPPASNIILESHRDAIESKILGRQTPIVCSMERASRPCWRGTTTSAASHHHTGAPKRSIGIHLKGWEGWKGILAKESKERVQRWYPEVQPCR